jgi:hypothetical protein
LIKKFVQAVLLELEDVCGDDDEEDDRVTNPLVARWAMCSMLHIITTPAT